MVDETTITVDAETLKNIREIAKDAALFRDTLSVLNGYLNEKHGCVIAAIEHNGINGVVWSRQEGSVGKVLFKNVSFTECLKFALAQEIAHDNASS